MEVLGVKKWILFLGCICFLCINIKINAQEVMDNVEETKKLIVLVDTSQTMEGNKFEREIEWIQQICVLGEGTGININFVCFDGSVKSPINGSDGEQSLNELMTISPSGKNTNLFAAMNQAVSDMNSSDAEYKCIVMLSDAQLDLDGRPKGTYNLGEREIESKNSFEAIVKKFNSGKKQAVILVEFDEGEQEMCINGQPEYIFRNLKKEGITYFSWKTEANKAIDYIFAQLNYPSFTTEREVCKNNKISFSVDEACYRVIVNIFNKGTNINRQEVESLKIDIKDSKTGETLEVSADNIFISTEGAYLYLKEPKLGDYTVELPDGQWECTKMYQKAIRIEGVEVAVAQKDTILNKSENTISTQQSSYDVYDIVNDSFQIGFQLDMSLNEDDMENSDIGVEYGIQRVEEMNDSKLDEESFEAERPLEKALGGYRLIELDKKDAGLYKCQVRVYSGGNHYSSQLFGIRVEDALPISEERKTVTIKEKIKLSDLTSGQDADEKVWVVVNDSTGETIEVFLIDELCDTEQFKAENGVLFFEQSGEYIVDIEREGIGGVDSRWHIIVGEEKNISQNWFEGMLEFFIDLFSELKY